MKVNSVGFILAAGFSKRLKALTENTPKSFLLVNDKKIIEYHLDNLLRIGVERTYIVIGFLKEIFLSYLGNSYKGMEIIFILNDAFAKTGHSYSLFLGNNIFKKNSIILVHADLYCDDCFYDMLISSSHENLCLVDANYIISTGDEYLVGGVDGVVNGISQKIYHNIQGEYVGLSKLSSEFMTDFCDYMRIAFNDPFSTQVNYEIMLDKFLREYSCMLHYKDIKSKKWININYPEDYYSAKALAQI